MPGVARRRLDDRAAGLEQARLLGRLDHRQPDAVLDRAARVEHLELRQEQRLAIAGPEIAREPRDADERRAAHEVEDRLGVLHRPRGYRRRTARLTGTASSGGARACGVPTAARRPDARPAPRRRSSPGAPAAARCAASRSASAARLRRRRRPVPRPASSAAVTGGEDPDHQPAPEEQLVVAADDDRHDGRPGPAGRRTRGPPRSCARSRPAPAGPASGNRAKTAPPLSTVGCGRQVGREGLRAAMRRDRQDAADAPHDPAPEPRPGHRPRIAEEHEPRLDGKARPTAGTGRSTADAAAPPRSSRRRAARHGQRAGARAPGRRSGTRAPRRRSARPPAGPGR